MNEVIAQWMFGDDEAYCSACNTVLDIDYNVSIIPFPLRCPECGALMKGIINI